MYLKFYYTSKTVRVLLYSIAKNLDLFEIYLALNLGIYVEHFGG